MYAVLPSDRWIRATGSSRPSSVRNAGRVISRRPWTWLPSSSTTVSTLAQSSPASGGSIAAWPCSHASAWYTKWGAGDGCQIRSHATAL